MSRSVVARVAAGENVHRSNRHWSQLQSGDRPAKSDTSTLVLTEKTPSGGRYSRGPLQQDGHHSPDNSVPPWSSPSAAHPSDEPLPGWLRESFGPISADAIRFQLCLVLGQLRFCGQLFMNQQVGNFLEFGRVGKLQHVIAAVMQVVTAAADGADRRTGSCHSGQRYGLLRLSIWSCGIGHDCVS